MIREKSHLTIFPAVPDTQHHKISSIVLAIPEHVTAFPVVRRKFARFRDIANHPSDFRELTEGNDCFSDSFLGIHRRH